MKGGDKMDKKQIWTIIVIALVVAAIVSIIASSITGNVIRSGRYQIYTKAEIDSAAKTLESSLRNRFDGTCKYIYHKDLEKGVPFDDVTIEEACKRYSSIPKVIVSTYRKTLYNKPDCSQSYQIFSTTADILTSYKSEISDITLGPISLQTCNNATFLDSTSNGNYSTGTFQYTSGVLCCRN